MIAISLYILKVIIEHLQCDIDIFNLLSSCKSTYQFKNSIRFINYPTHYLSDKQSLLINNEDSMNIHYEGSFKRILHLFKRAKIINSNHNHNDNKSTTPLSSTSDINNSKSFRSVPPMKYKKLLIRSPMELNYYQVNVDSIDVMSMDINYPNFKFDKSLRFPSHLTKLVLGDTVRNGVLPEITDVLEPGLIPNTVQSLILGYNLPYKLIEGSLPSSLIELTIMYNFDGYSGFEWPKVIPKNTLVSLEFREFNSKLNVGDLQEPLERLSLGNAYQQDTPVDLFPQTLKYLHLGINFNGRIGSLPRGLVSLELGNNGTGVRPLYPYDLLGTGLVPDSTKTLTLGSFDQEIHSSQLPSSLKSLKLPRFNGQLTMSLLLNVTELTFDKFNQAIQPGSLPPSLKYLEFKGNFNQDLLVGSLPETLEFLHLSYDYNKPIAWGVLPKSLRVLRMGSQFNSHIYQYPSGLEELVFGFSFNKSLNCLATQSPKLKILRLGTRFQQTLNALPQSLTELYIRYCYSGLLKYLPVNIEILVFENFESFVRLEESILNSLTNLRSMVLGRGYSHQIMPMQIPRFLKYLEFGFDYSFPIIEDSLPETLEVLKFGSQYRYKITTKMIPKSLRILYLPLTQRDLILSEDCVLPFYCKVIYT
ncbi:hypothetical protein DLAC_02927 [Tieghemostelium lacteum]|uniref:FNIP repeat-containing protein n=1 Tax=Tieghemostelium lacteum TaxID=361077 RepID=A0A152A3U1_TIELA|nr:hypothetical protein DLAC_02927 [Tieghemostelium lacteum]|eukprot:KYR00869.1 hypothetical protein DLAC_02927 [Tieghemostelium lacteum]